VVAVFIFYSQAVFISYLQLYLTSTLIYLARHSTITKTGLMGRFVAGYFESVD